MSRIGGVINFKTDSNFQKAKGDFTYNIGVNKREAIMGNGEVHGFKEMPQVPFIEGAITDSKDTSLEQLLSMENANITLELANGKVIALYDAWYANEGTGNTAEGEIPVRFEAIDGEEIR